MVRYTRFLKIVEATYCSIKNGTKYFNYYATKEAIAEVTLQICFQTNKTYCNLQTNVMLVFFFVFFQCTK